jgi:hypothetical protein
VRYIFQVTGVFSGMFSGILQSIKRCIGGLLGPILAHLIHFALVHPSLKARALAFVCRYPALESWLYRFSRTNGLITGSMTMQIDSDPSRLTPSAFRIYTDLKAAVERYDKERQ